MEELKQMEIMKLAESGSPTVFLAILLLVCSKCWNFLIKFLSDKDLQIIELKKELANERELHRKETKESRKDYIKTLELITSKLENKK